MMTGSSRSATVDPQFKSLPFPEFITAQESAPRFAGVIIDFDGTLVDSMDTWDRLDVDFCAKHGIHMPPEQAEMITALGFEGTARYFIEELGLRMTVEECIECFNDMAYDNYASHIICKPGAREYVHALKERGVRLSIASSLDGRLLRAGLAHNRLEGFFDGIALCDECGKSKFESDVFYLAAERMGVAPQDCLVFDDITVAIRSAHAAGMTTCGVFDGHKQQDTAVLRATADYFIDSFEELLGF